jgi:ferritin-like metal-binding protein YciE
MKTEIDTPLELLFDRLREIHSMEIQLCEAMPRLVSLCTNDELHDLIVSHAHQNGNQIAEIDAIFDRHGESPEDDGYTATKDLIEGGCARLREVRSPHTRDLMMIAHCLRIEYLEMAAYEFTAILSGRLGLMREPAILSELLAEEKDMATALRVLDADLFETANRRACGSSKAGTDRGLWRRSHFCGMTNGA